MNEIRNVDGFYYTQTHTSTLLVHMGSKGRLAHVLYFLQQRQKKIIYKKIQYSSGAFHLLWKSKFGMKPHMS